MNTLVGIYNYKPGEILCEEPNDVVFKAICKQWYELKQDEVYYGSFESWFETVIVNIQSRQLQVSSEKEWNKLKSHLTYFKITDKIESALNVS